MNDKKTQTTLTLGGTGKIGRRVAQRLATFGRPVRIGSRSGRPPFDWQDRATWPAVLDGTAGSGVWGVPAVSGASR